MIKARGVEWSELELKHAERMWIEDTELLSNAYMRVCMHVFKRESLQSNPSSSATNRLSFNLEECARAQMQRVGGGQVSSP